MSTDLQKRDLPTLEELYSNETLTLPEKIGTLNVLLNGTPNPKWIRKNKFANNTDYIPIERQEWLMTYVFGRWHVEILSIQLVANSVCATVRVHYFDPLTDAWRWTDGTGAVPIQIKRDTGGAIDFQNMQPNAIQLAAPAAKSYAFKDAVESLGRLFGRDLNRKEQIGYEAMLPDGFASESEVIELQTLAKSCGENLSEHLSEYGVSDIAQIPSGAFKKVKASLLSVIKYQNEHGK